MKKGRLDAASYSLVLSVMTQLNKVGAQLAANPKVSAITDVTGKAGVKP